MPPFSSESVTRRGWIAIPLVGMVGILAFYALPVGTTRQSAVYDLVGFAAVGAALAVTLARRPPGWQAWAVMALGQLSFVVGDIIWTVYDALGGRPFPSIADVAYILGYPLIGLGLLAAIRRRITGGDRAGLLDAAILATGAGVVWWSFILGPVAASADPDPLSFAISVAYPVGDLVLLGFALGLIMTPGARTPSFRFLVASLVVLLVGDLVFNLQTLQGTYVDGGLLDGVWLVAYLLFSMAAAHPTMAMLAEPRPVAVSLLGPLRLCLLGLAMLVGPALLVAERSLSDPIVLVVAGATALLSILVITRLAGMVGHLARDIARRQVLEDQLSFQAFHDPLTGLANRRRLMAAVARAIAGPEGAAVLFLDLDDFKDINDNMGHDAGDALLSVVGERIVAAIRSDALACRLGGDEFAIVIPGVDGPEQVEPVAARLVEVLAAPVELEGSMVRVPASVGIGLRAASEPITVDELVRRADVAMYQAKARGKQRWAAYSPSMDAVVPEPPRRAVTRGAAPAA